MAQKKRTTLDDPLPKKQKVTKKIVEEKINLPKPATEGPVMPPKSRSIWLVYIIGFLFFLLTFLAIAVTWRTFINKDDSLDGVVESTTVPEEEFIYSYTSVVYKPEVESPIYKGTENECFFENNSLGAPLSNDVGSSISLLFNLVVPDEVIESGQEEFAKTMSRLATFIGWLNTAHIHATIYISEVVAQEAKTQGLIEFSSWAEQGHEMALLFQPGKYFQIKPEDINTVPYGSWLLGLHAGQAAIEELTGVSVTALSGGGDFTNLFAVEDDLGFVSYTDFDDRYMVANPWTPIAAGEELDTFDPFGKIVYLPSGLYPDQCTNPSLVNDSPLDVRLSYVTLAIQKTQEHASGSYLNLIQVNVPVSFLTKQSDDDFALWQDWIENTLGQQIKKKILISTTASEEADAYFAWIDGAIGDIEFVEKNP